MRIPQTYYPRESPVHELDPRVKLVLLIALTIALFVVTTWRGLGVLVAAVVLALAASRLPLGVIARSLIPFYVLMAFAVVVNSFTLNPDVLATAYGVGGVSAGVFEGAAPVALVAGWHFMPASLVRSLFYCVRILCMVVASLLVAYSTPATRLTEGLAWFMRPLERLRVPVNDIALTFTLALRFIPLAFEELQETKLAQMARGASFGVGGLWRRVNAWVPVMVPWLVSLYRRASRIATAMDVRAYGMGETHTTLALLKMRPADAVMLAFGLAVCVVPCVLFA
ncbi:MAG: energy-coupling factor transporter transmembrane protein EcfT [Coriobacteriaceae bacterium]|nr:energy-coupling factor transporter transmembrane protein EcfT [Coriobacteriaceae bacterium]